LGTLDPAVHEGTEERDQTDLVGGHHQKRRVQSAALMNQHVGTARPSQRTERKKRSVPICVSVIGNDNSFVRRPKRGHDDLEKLPTQVKREGERETERETDLCCLRARSSTHIQTFVVWGNIESQWWDHRDGLLAGDVAIVGVLDDPLVKALQVFRFAQSATICS
jgi:hypothetical protein